MISLSTLDDTSHLERNENRDDRRLSKNQGNNPTPLSTFKVSYNFFDLEPFNFLVQESIFKLLLSSLKINNGVQKVTM